MSSDPLLEKLAHELGERGKELTTELSSSLDDLFGPLRTGVEELRQQPAGAPQPLEAWLETHQQLDSRFLLEPLEAYRRRPALSRALLAVQTCDRRLERFIHSLPAPQEWREGLSRGLQRASKSRSQNEGQLFVAAVSAGVGLLGRWRLALDLSLGLVSPEQAQARCARELSDMARLESTARAALAHLGSWFQRVGPRLKASQAAPGQARAQARDHLESLVRHLDNVHKLARELARVDCSTTQAGLSLMRELQSEREALLACQSRLQDWLSRRLQGEGPGPIPDTGPGVPSAATRREELRERIRHELRKLPPIQLLGQLTPQGLRQARANLDAAGFFGQLFEVVTRRSPVHPLVEAIVAESQGFQQELGRVVQVVEFAQQLPERESTDLLQEALGNAQALCRSLTFQVSLQEASQAMSLRNCEVGSRGVALLSSDQERAAYILKRRLEQRMAAAGELAQDWWGRSKLGASEGWRAALRQSLVWIGWLPPLPPRRSRVERRAWLPEEFALEQRLHDLPQLYLRLFYPEPVQDHRFLVGRQREMETLGELRTLWLSQHPTSLILVGERGSGKSSLINCALARFLAQDHVVRGEPHRRITGAADMREFLADLVEAPGPDRIERHLAERPTVVILEEVERCFLRQVGCLDAIRELCGVISASALTTLWILSVNETAFRFLDRSVALGQVFSHRINVAHSGAAALREAILMRHNLSGLGLQFRAPEPPRWSTRAPLPPEESFFNLLADASGGAFRAAFELWLGHIDEVLDSTAYLRPFQKADLGALMSDLDEQDVFTLVALSQHGSLTVGEHQAVFQCSPEVSRYQMQELLSRQLIQPDPHHPGYRLRPEVREGLKQAFYRKNLI